MLDSEPEITVYLPPGMTLADYEKRLESETTNRRGIFVFAVFFVLLVMILTGGLLCQTL